MKYRNDISSKILYQSEDKVGRKRIDENDKKIRVSISIKKALMDELREKNINISQLIEELVKNYLKR